MYAKLYQTGRGFVAIALCVLLCTQGMINPATAESEAAPAISAEAAAPVSDTPTVAPTATPTATPTDSPADTPTATPETTESPTDTATDEPVVTTDATVTPEPEDTPPVCDIPDCPHVTTDPSGKVIALCPLGEWMLAHGMTTLATFTADPAVADATASDPSEIALDAGTTVIYRSGSYVMTGGTATTKIIINDKLAVSLVLKNATVDLLTLGNEVALQLGFTGTSTVATLHAGNGATTLNGTGCLTVSAVDDLATAQLTMGGGNLLLPSGAVSLDGNVCFHTYASGATSATVDGAAFPFTLADSSGMAHLWLPAPDAGEDYHSTVASGVLVVKTVAEEPSTTITFDMSGTADFVAGANQNFSIIASATPLYHLLTVDKTGASLVFNGVDLSGYADVQALEPTRLHLLADSRIRTLSGAGTVTVTGAGILDVIGLNASSLKCASSVRLRYQNYGGACLDGWQTLASPVSLDTITQIVYNGKARAMAYSTADLLSAHVQLSAPAAGMRYDVRQNGTTLEITQIPTGTQTLTLGSSAVSITAAGSYVIVTDGLASGNLTVADGLNVSLVFRHATTSGSLQVGAGASVSLALEGSNRLTAGVTLGAGATFALSGKGALLTGGVTASGAASTTVASHTNLSLTSGSALAGCSLKPTVINVTDNANLPLCDTAITLRVGTASPFWTTTAADGHVTLWGSKTVSNASAVVLSRADTYADILTGNPANPDALPEITGVTVHTAGYVTYTATNAQTTGIQVYINRSGVTMPDTYDPGAILVPRLFGECNIPGLKSGDQVTFRVYAARGSGQTLSAETADAFQFSDMYTYTAGTVRKTYTLKDQTKEYDLYAFEFDSGLIPKGASVTFYKNGVALSSAPTDVGAYTATVTIPAGHATYAPVVITINVTITRKIVWIYPDYASKIKGQADPELTYTYSGMFGSDTVTGPLTRYKGENHGNYPYVTRWLVAPSYYELKIDPDSAMFYIDWGPGHYIKVDPLSIIDPVRQTIEYSDGTKLTLVLRTADKLTISGETYGGIVIDTQDRKVRPFTPELRLKHGYDQAMLIVQAEPEINDDGGYATDADGNIQLRSRTLSMTTYHLNRFKNQHITTLGFRLSDAMCMVDLSDLTSDAVRQAMSDHGMTMSGTRFQITLSPVNSVSDLSESSEAAQTDKALGAEMMGMRIELKNGDVTLDISSLLTTARTIFDVSSMLSAESETSPEISEVTIGKKAGETTDDSTLTTDVMELVQKLMLGKLEQLGTRFNYYTDGVETLDSSLVVPYTASETGALPFTAVMQTSPFLMAKLTANGLYGLGGTQAP